MFKTSFLDPYINPFARPTKFQWPVDIDKVGKNVAEISDIISSELFPYLQGLSINTMSTHEKDYCSIEIDKQGQ